jgi:hypothetical protein
MTNGDAVDIRDEVPGVGSRVLADFLDERALANPDRRWGVIEDWEHMLYSLLTLLAVCTNYA